MLSKHLFIILIFSAHGVSAQNNQSDTIFRRQMLDSMITFYNKSLGENTMLYNGREYTGNYARTVGHPFYASDQPQKGSVLYGGVLYSHEAISYDLIEDEVFIKTGQNVSLKLIKQKIEHFSLGDQVFVQLTGGPDKNDALNGGFYEVLYAGRMTVIAKRRKQLERSFNLEDPYKFVQYDRYFIKSGENYHEVESEGSLLSLFPGRQKELRKYMRGKGMSFKKNREYTIVQVAKYYAE